ncbi:unnamed protein product [Acanthoscelides obtectus]|uniref:Uncharacterized protein n=1 Tax=Acanthoscelides obtectus TaxID=200917 RepID=A0A9P0JXC2_ACAOB|nr:unnamed protein product [Acanthoscelides obtectus]CAK1653049.1 hypothetical protein AOBTE_LOCUS18033 [Acanthoscelides obtectus]
MKISSADIFTSFFFLYGSHVLYNERWNSYVWMQFDDGNIFVG